MDNPSTILRHRFLPESSAHQSGGPETQGGVDSELRESDQTNRRDQLYHQRSPQSYSQNYLPHDEYRSLAPRRTIFENMKHQTQTDKKPKRSNPIAINPVSQVGSILPDSDDDDHSLTEHSGLNGKSQTGQVQVKGPQQKMEQKTSQNNSDELLKAPYLGSMSRSESYLTRQENLLYLPPMSLSEFQGVPNDTINYGSLRESHEIGRFMDGPASYRDRRSGQIKLIERGSRTVNSSMPQVSIGERMQRFRKIREIQKKKEAKTTARMDLDGEQQQPTSTLSALMDGASLDDEVNSIPALSTTYPDKTIAMNDVENTYEKTYGPSNISSTSLTGFEILKASPKFGMPSYAQSLGTTHSVARFVPRAPPPAIATGRADQQPFQPLSRSMSDPTPQFHLPGNALSERPSVFLSHPPSYDSFANENLPIGEPAPQEPQQEPSSELHHSGQPNFDSRAAAMAVINDLSCFTLPSSTGYTFDGGAFDMDME